MITRDKALAAVELIVAFLDEQIEEKEVLAKPMPVIDDPVESLMSDPMSGLIEMAKGFMASSVKAPRSSKDEKFDALVWSREQLLHIHSHLKFDV